jgi:hypothetical protein
MKARINENAIDSMGVTIVDFDGLRIGQDWVFVDGLGRESIARLTDNPCFDVEGSAAPLDAVDVEGVDVKGLREEAAGLGVDVDRRWGAVRLQAEIDKVLGE